MSEASALILAIAWVIGKLIEDYSRTNRLNAEVRMHDETEKRKRSEKRPEQLFWRSMTKRVA